ncbi:putative membrane protein [Paramicrosporidium saccamoebae]|uniref:Putative membrane protein n=1 Tax=Paramicrosporidium saccamoebae TaxID=1246581 RepID=A0A2H9TL03_9FUNG|nr:putative membrane protein [Paramicrosporidium saccamoebae]
MFWRALLLLTLVKLIAAQEAERFESVIIGLGWNTFAFGPAGSSVGDGYRVNSTTPVLLRITDFSCSGDQFEVFVDKVSQGNTSVPIFDNCLTYTADPNAAFFSTVGWSRAYYILPAGPHEITLKTVLSPFGEGLGAIRFDYNTYLQPT